MPDFNSNAVLAQLRAELAARKKARYSRSKLDKFKGEILRLKNSGANNSEIVFFLKQKKISVHRSTVSRWIKKNG